MCLWAITWGMQSNLYIVGRLGCEVEINAADICRPRQGRLEGKNCAPLHALVFSVQYAYIVYAQYCIPSPVCMALYYYRLPTPCYAYVLAADLAGNLPKGAFEPRRMQCKQGAPTGPLRCVWLHVHL
jgi:hypothetical protein